MPYVDVAPMAHADRLASAEARWAAVLAARPDLEPAVALQRRLIGTTLDLAEAVEGARLPRLSLPPKYLIAKLARGVPALAGEPIPLPVNVLRPGLLEICEQLAQGGAGEAAEHIRHAIASGALDAGSLLAASVAREQTAIRSAAAHRGLAADLLWLVAELAAGPFVHALERALFAPAHADEALGAALAGWHGGYCPACGSWPAVAELLHGRRVLRCSFCAAAWEGAPGACLYCGTSGSLVVDDRVAGSGRELATCRACSGYLKVVAVEGLSPFPLVAIADLETMDLDVAAMQGGFTRPPLKAFSRR